MHRLLNALERRVPPLIVMIALGAVMAVGARGWPRFGFALGTGPLLAAGLVAVGLAVVALGVVSFRRVGTTLNPLRPGSASRLVVSGIYHRTRNPMYLGMLLLLLAWGVFLGNGLSVALAFAFVPWMNRFQIEPEERALAERFGPDFAAYRSAVGRWI